MKIRCLFFFLWIALSFSANSEDVFKCLSSQGEMIYQSTPCTTNEISKGELKLKDMTPQEVAAAKAKLKAEEAEEANFEAEKAKAEKQAQIELEQQEKLDLQRRSIEAQEKQAAALQQQRHRAFGSINPPAYGEINP